MNRGHAFSSTSRVFWGLHECCECCLDVHCQDESHRLVCQDESHRLVCQDESHRQVCDDFPMTLMKCVENTADVCLPSRGGNQNKDLKKTPLCSWNAEIQPFKDKAMFWHAIWVSAGRPMYTQLPCSGMQFGFQLEDLCTHSFHVLACNLGFSRKTYVHTASMFWHAIWVSAGRPMYTQLPCSGMQYGFQQEDLCTHNFHVLACNMGFSRKTYVHTTSMFWHAIWVSAGRPMYTQLPCSGMQYGFQQEDLCTHNFHVLACNMGFSRKTYVHTASMFWHAIWVSAGRPMYTQLPCSVMQYGFQQEDLCTHNFHVLSCNMGFSRKTYVHTASSPNEKDENRISLSNKKMQENEGYTQKEHLSTSMYR